MKIEDNVRKLILSNNIDNFKIALEISKYSKEGLIKFFINRLSLELFTLITKNINFDRSGKFLGMKGDLYINI